LTGRALGFSLDPAKECTLGLEKGWAVMKIRVLIATFGLLVFAGCASVDIAGVEHQQLAAADACSALRPASSCYCRMARIRCR
jgi:hypothetical protein